MSEPTLGHAVALSQRFGVAVEVSQVERFMGALNQLAHSSYLAGWQDCQRSVDAALQRSVEQVAQANEASAQPSVSTET
jgi:hypothetical protein